MQKARIISLRSFTNSFLRDFSGSEFILYHSDAVEIKLTEDQSFRISVKKYSLVGNHSYTGSIIHLVNGDANQVDVLFFVSSIAQYFEIKHNAEFENYFKNSYNNISKSLEYNLIDNQLSTYLRSEKSLKSGHPFHPYPKCKWPLSEKDMITYAPEFEGRFKLIWIKIDQQFLWVNHSQALVELKQLVDFDLRKIERDELWMPMHPLQFKQQMHSSELSSLIVDQREGVHDWYALSSMRSVYHPEAPFILKFSLSLKMTNSYRLLHQKEMERGALLTQIAQENEINYSNSNFYIQHEPYFLSLKLGALPQEEFFVQLRQPIPEELNIHETYLLSSLVEDSFVSSIIAERAQLEKLEVAVVRKRWFQNYLANVLSHFIQFYHQDGILLGAHLQNVLVELKDGYPQTSVFRDCQGVGFSQETKEKFESKFPALKDFNGNILKEQEVNKVFGYYLIVNNAFGVISGIAEGDEKVERALLSDLRGFLLSCLKQWPNSTFIQFLLDSDVLYQKGNFRCSLMAMNETTAENPWQLYNQIPNPLKNELRPRREDKNIFYESYNNRGQKVSFTLYNHQTDLDILHSWHHKPFVSNFWELNIDKEKMQNHMQMLLESISTLPLIFRVNDQAVGYFECYWAMDDRIAAYCNTENFDRGIHLLIGEKDFLDGQTSYDAILHVTHFLFKNCAQTNRVWGEPRVDNRRILQLAERLPGWNFIREFQFPHKRANLLCCEREDFYRELKYEL